MEDDGFIGLRALFGHDAWTPCGSNNSTAAFQMAFQSILNNGHIDQAPLMDRIPEGCPNTFDFEPRSQRGFKFVWTSIDGSQWSVHGHEPDAGAKQGHIGGTTWTCRIMFKLGNVAPEPYAGAPRNKFIMLLADLYEVRTGAMAGAKQRWYHTNAVVGSSHVELRN